MYIPTFGQKGHKSYQRMCTERITTLFDVKVFFTVYTQFYTDAKFDNMNVIREVKIAFYYFYAKKEKLKASFFILKSY